jgi:hypothetical protein
MPLLNIQLYYTIKWYKYHKLDIHNYIVLGTKIGGEIAIDTIHETHHSTEGQMETEMTLATMEK